MKTKLFLSLFFTLLLGVSNSVAQTGCQGQFKTFTIGGWGTHCNGNNPGCYRDANFAGAFPSGLTIGCGSNTLTLTSTLAVEQFLPSGGTPALLSGNSVDPAGSISNTLASQLVAITLAVGFDVYDPNFSASSTSFGSLTILQGPHAGMSVSSFLAYANQVIGGCVSGNLSSINATATAINENFDNGTVDNGYLDCNTNRLACNPTSTPLSCYGGSNATITISVSGGTAPYSYSLNGGTPIVSNNSSYTFSGLSAGTYTVAVVQVGTSIGCSEEVTIVNPLQIQSTSSSTDVSCFGGNNGTATIASVTNAASPYTILWSTGATTNSISGLSYGTYTYTITDANGCSRTFSVSIGQPTVLGYTSSLTNVTCYGANNGSATITPTGGISPYTILWNNGSTSFTRGGLAASVVYTAVITDANGCTANVSVSVTQPSALGVGTVKTQALCFGGNGTATATATGGTSPYNYSWNTNPVQLSATASLPVGTWTVTVTDANGCTVSSSVTITLQSCEGFTTITQGGYGAKCSGGNWGCYLVSNFASKFPSGLTIGSNGRFLVFTSAAAVQGFLPSGTTPRALNVGTMTNPTSKTYSNVLAGQVVALTLSLGFDTNPAFSPSSTPLGSLIVSSGIFAGKTVNDLLAIANAILGGAPSPYTADQINAAIDNVNRNYDNGTSNLGYLACPCSTSAKIASTSDSGAGVKADVTVYPNPVKSNSTLEFTLNYDSKVKVVIYNINGQLVNEVYEGNVSSDVQNAINISSSNMKAGVYILKLSTDRESVTKSLLIAE
jgi:hypothetical protein